VTFPNGQTRNYSYDDQGRLLQLANLHPTAGNLATYGYGYDLNHATGANTMLGQRVTMTANVPAQGFANAVTKYYYDAAYQLTRADYPAGAPFNGEVHQWTYDLIGNRLTNTVNGVTQNYTYQKLGGNPKNWQRLISDTAKTYEYDANGSSASRGAASFAWSVENRLAGITGSTPVQYTYDYMGRRTSRTEIETAASLLDRLNSLYESGENGAHRIFGPALDEPLSQFASGQLTFYVGDDKNSLTLLVGAAGAVIESRLSDAWGQSRLGSAAAGTLDFTAREREVYGLQFNRIRYLDPSIGRFITEDPMRFWAGINFYGYVLNDPLSYTDPLGLAVRTCCRRIPGLGAKHCFFQFSEGWTIGLHAVSSVTDPDALLSLAWAGTGRLEDHNGFDTPDPGDKGCGEWSTCPTADECVQREAWGSPIEMRYHLLWSNSNSFAGSITRKCSVPAPPFADRLQSPGWFYPRPRGW
jgi:RHS repeat-associated protein